MAAEWGRYSPRGWQGACFAIYQATRNKELKRRLRAYLERAADIYDINQRGLKMRCHIRDNLTERDIVFGGKFDNARELSLIEKHLRPGGVFLDVGANCGIFSLMASRIVGESGRVVAIEPNPILCERLRFNIAANGLRNISVAECAIGAAAGRAELSLHETDVGQSGLIAGSSGRGIEVAVRTLKEVVDELGIERIDAAKVDVEGFEDRVIMPFIRTAAKSIWPRAMLIEIVHAYLWRDACVLALEDSGYQTAWKSRSDVLLALP
jgi:FkbM family methyltransferase